MGGVALFDIDGVVFEGELFEFFGLRQIAKDEFQVFGLIEAFVVAGGLIAVGDDVACNGPQEFVRAEVG